MTVSMVIGERHPQRVMAKYVDYYNRTRAHLSQAKDAPEPLDSAAAEPQGDGGGATRR